MARLSKPSLKYKASFIKAVEEFKKENRNQNFDPKELKKDFPAFVKMLRNKEKGIGLKKGRVPETVFWLVDKNKFIGRVSVRHHLTPKLKMIGGHIGYEIRPTQRRKGYGKMILALALKEALKLKLKEVLVTCNKDNVASKKIIEKNGGILVKRYRLKPDKAELIYRIKIK